MKLHHCCYGARLLLIPLASLASNMPVVVMTVSPLRTAAPVSTGLSIVLFAAVLQMKQSPPQKLMRTTG